MCNLDKISQCLQLNAAQAVRKASTLSFPLQNWKTMMLKFTHFYIDLKNSTLYFHVSSKNQQTEPRNDYLFLKLFSHTSPASQLTHTMPLKRKCWSNVHPKDKLCEKAQLHTPVGGRGGRKRALLHVKGNALGQDRAGNSSASGISFVVLADEQNPQWCWTIFFSFF